MPSLRGWIEKIERRMPDPINEDKEREWVIGREILDEIGSLQGAKATHSYRGGTPPTPIQTTDPTGDALGYPYTWGDLVRFAIRCVFERNSGPSESSAESSVEASWDLEGLVLERSINLWTEAFRDMSGEDGWDRVEAEGPPEPPRPWC
jgi:hypothetical protein